MVNPWLIFRHTPLVRQSTPSLQGSVGPRNDRSAFDVARISFANPSICFAWKSVLTFIVSCEPTHVIGITFSTTPQSPPRKTRESISGRCIGPRLYRAVDFRDLIPPDVCTSPQTGCVANFRFPLSGPGGKTSDASIDDFPVSELDPNSHQKMGRIIAGSHRFWMGNDIEQNLLRTLDISINRSEMRQ